MNFLTAMVLGCSFHCKQAIDRKITKQANEILVRVEYLKSIYPINQKTNNALERYNRHIHFLAVIKEESRYFSLCLNNIRKGSEPCLKYNDPFMPIIPDDYENF
ncbi:hypothetical protein MXB_5572 [Myxobolus squamalis]|nr:hypothetical protein MXB_5572 [Myxobolus squamalis]